MKFCKLKWVFVALSFLTAGISRAADYNYRSLSEDGNYQQAKAGFSNFLANAKDDPSELQNITINLSLFLRDASRFGDYDAVDWLQKHIKEHEARLKKVNNSDADIDAFRLLILSDIAVINNPAYTHESRQEIIDSHENIRYPYLWDAELIFVCNQIIDFYLGTGNIKDAQQRANSCLGQIALRNMYSLDEALSFIARFSQIRLSAGTQSGDNRILSAIGKALGSERLNFFSPTAMDAMANLALAEASRGNPFVKNIHDFALGLVGDGVYVPEYLSLKFQYAFDTLDSIYGLDGERRLEANYSKPATEMFLKWDELKRFNLNQPTQGFVQYTKPSDAMGVVHELYELVNIPPVVENRALIEKLLGEFVEKTWSLYQPTNSGLSFENQDGSFERFALRTLLKYFSSIEDELISESFATFLFAVVFRPKTQADYFSAVAGNSILASSEMHKLARSQLKLSKDLNDISVNLVEKIINKSIAFHESDYAFKKRDDVRTDGELAYNFLSDHRYLQRSSQQFDTISNGQLTKTFAGTLLDLKKIQSALNDDQVLIAYKRFPSNKFENFVFKCKITAALFDCSNQTVSPELPQQISTLRTQIVTDKGKAFDTNLSSKVFKNLFPVVDLAEYKEILLFPDEQDIGLPFAALVTQEEKFLGKDYNLSLLTSLTPGYRAREIKPPQKAYLALGDPAYQELVVADLKQNDVFKLRSSSQAQELSDLSLLPETRQEILEISSLLPEIEQKVLLGSDATELNFRLSTPGQYKIVHFATHGLIEGDFETIREPALALSPNVNFDSTLDDSLLTETEILELDFQGTSIILSACQTAGNFGAANSSGFKGLANAFLLAGAETVIATQWKIESSSAAQIVSDTVQLIINGSDQSSALSQSMQKYHLQNSKNPYYWAPYVKFKSLKLKNPQEPIIGSGQQKLQLEFPSDGYFEPYELKNFKGMIYANGTYTKYSDENKLNFSQSVLVNINNQSKIWLPPKYSAYRFLTNSADGFRMLGTVNEGLNVDPAILDISLVTGVVKVIYRLRVIDTLFKHGSKFILQMGGVRAFEEHDDGSLSLVVEQMMHPDSPQSDKYEETDDFIKPKYWYLKLSDNFEILKLEKLPLADHAKAIFFNERLYFYVQNFEIERTLPNFQNSWGRMNCERTSVNLYEYDFRYKSFAVVQNFPGVMSLSNLADGRLFVNEYCDRDTYTSIYNLENNEVSGRLPVVLGGVSGKAVKLKDQGYIHFGEVKSPVSFLKLKHQARDKDLNIIYTKIEDLAKRNYVIAPNDQYLQYLIYEDLEGNIFNLDLKFSRILSFYADGIVDGQFLYLLESEERETNYVTKIDLNSISQVISSRSLQ